MGRTGLEHRRRGQQKPPLMMGDGHRMSLQGLAGRRAPGLMGSTWLDAGAQLPSKEQALDIEFVSVASVDDGDTGRV